MNVIISQALATGLPVIATRHSGLPEQVIDGRSGFLVDEADYRALAEKIVFMIEHPEIWANMGQEGRKHITEKYRLPLIIGRQLELYEKIIYEK